MPHNKHLLLMLLGCGLMILVLVVFKDRLTDGWLFALVIGACVIPHLFMMRGGKHGAHHQQEVDPGFSAEGGSASGGSLGESEVTDDDKPSTHKGGSCCH